MSGIPGTGKTATVLEVMRGFKRRVEEGSAHSFQFVEINGLRLPSPQHAYSTLYEVRSSRLASAQSWGAGLAPAYARLPTCSPISR